MAGGLGISGKDMRMSMAEERTASNDTKFAVWAARLGETKRCMRLVHMAASDCQDERTKEMLARCAQDMIDQFGGYWSLEMIYPHAKDHQG